MPTDVKRSSCLRCIVIVLIIICIFLSIFSFYAGQKIDLFYKIAVRLGIAPQGGNGKTEYAVICWDNCLSKISYDCDVAFFGDSLTQDSNFNEYFDDVEICNLGYGGDSLLGMQKRVHMVQTVTPEKIFLMGGINSLRDNAIETTFQSYVELLDMLQSTVPNAQIYIQSVLPITTYRESRWLMGSLCKNSTIREFNTMLQSLAEERGLTYINLYDIYALDDKSMNPELTIDGVHICGHYDLWAEAIKEYIYE